MLIHSGIEYITKDTFDESIVILRIDLINFDFDIKLKFVQYYFRNYQ